MYQERSQLTRTRGQRGYLSLTRVFGRGRRGLDKQKQIEYISCGDQGLGGQVA